VWVGGCVCVCGWVGGWAVQKRAWFIFLTMHGNIDAHMKVRTYKAHTCALVVVGSPVAQSL
jgi:hypothetical protein